MKQNPQKVHYSDLHPGEKIHLFVRRHPVSLSRWFFAALFMGLLPWLAALSVVGINTPESIIYIFETLLVCWYLLLIGAVLENFLLWYFDIYLVTNKRVVDIDVNFNLHRKVAEIDLETVQYVTYQSTGLLGALFDVGSVCVETYGGQKDFKLLNVHRPSVVHDLITDQIQGSKKNAPSL